MHSTTVSYFNFILIGYSIQTNNPRMYVEINVNKQTDVLSFKKRTKTNKQTKKKTKNRDSQTRIGYL